MLGINGQNETKFADFEQYFDGFLSLYFCSVIYDHTVLVSLNFFQMFFLSSYEEILLFDTYYYMNVTV